MTILCKWSIMSVLGAWGWCSDRSTPRLLLTHPHIACSIFVSVAHLGLGWCQQLGDMLDDALDNGASELLGLCLLLGLLDLHHGHLTDGCPLGRQLDGDITADGRKLGLGDTRGQVLHAARRGRVNTCLGLHAALGGRAVSRRAGRGEQECTGHAMWLLVQARETPFVGGGAEADVGFQPREVRVARRDPFGCDAEDVLVHHLRFRHTVRESAGSTGSRRRGARLHLGPAYANPEGTSSSGRLHPLGAGRLLRELGLTNLGDASRGELVARGGRGGERDGLGVEAREEGRGRLCVRLLEGNVKGE
mmetsp:Transcript_12018/g.27457  ORF Transcript_12018/g.27457 Transcript_12018/m.27457 type:complete len:305 (-) Transcript_12018:723-1637(-)